MTSSSDNRTKPARGRFVADSSAKADEIVRCSLVKLCGPRAVVNKSDDPVTDSVKAYLEYNAASEERYLEFYRIQRTLADAVEKSTMAELPSGKRFSHQRRIPWAVLVKAKDKLLKVNLKSCRTFDELHQLVKGTIHPIHGIGELTVYDTAHRIGAYLGLRPDLLYVHAGVRAGLKAIAHNHRVDKLSVRELPRAFWKLRPEQVEDCLCIYKRELAQARK